MSRTEKTKDIGITDDRSANERGIGRGIHSEIECCDGDACSWENTSKRSVEETEV